MAVLKPFGYTIEQLSGTKDHSLSNIITIQSDVHEWPTRLEIWFEKMPTTVSKQSHSIHRPRQREPPRSIRACTLLVPRSPNFFRAAEDMDKQDEGLGVLAENGSSTLSGGTERRPVEEHEPTYAAGTKT